MLKEEETKRKKKEKMRIEEGKKNTCWYIDNKRKFIQKRIINYVTGERKIKEKEA